MEERNYTVYKHTSPSNKVYIGITNRKLEYRWKNGNGYRNNKHFTNAINKYGWDNIKHEILFEKLTEYEAKIMEQMYIALYDSSNPKNGYNKTLGGDGTKGYKLTEKQRKKRSEKSKKMWQNPEHRELMSTKIKEKWNDEEYKKSVAKKIKATKRTHESREKTRQQSKKMWENQEYRELMSTKIKEMWQNPEHRELITLKLKEIWQTPEYKEKASIRAKEMWQNEEYREKFCKKVICLNTLEVFKSMKDADLWIGKGKLTKSHVRNCCEGKFLTTGNHPITGERLTWMYYDEYLKASPEEIKHRLLLITKAHSKKVICLNNKKIFDTLADAGQYAGLSNSTGIINNCKGKCKSAGKHPITGEKLEWMYYEEYLELQTKRTC